MKNILKFVFYIFLIISCDKEDINLPQTDNDGALISLAYEWKKELNQNGIFSNGYISEAIYHNGNILIPTTNGENNRF